MTRDAEVDRARDLTHSHSYWRNSASNLSMISDQYPSGYGYSYGGGGGGGGGYDYAMGGVSVLSAADLSGLGLGLAGSGPDTGNGRSEPVGHELAHRPDSSHQRNPPDSFRKLWDSLR
jgi:hypothetical protein